MTGSLSLAAAQTIPSGGDVEENLAQHLRLVRAAAEAGVQAAVFPELSLTGYEMALPAPLAFTEQDARLEPLAAAASVAGMTVVVGAPVRSGDRLYRWTAAAIPLNQRA